MIRVKAHYPVAVVDVEARGASIAARWFPKLHVLAWPDENGRYGDPSLVVRDFRSPSPKMLERDVQVRAQLMEMGLSVREVCALDNMELSDSPLVREVRMDLPEEARSDYVQRLEDHEDAASSPVEALFGDVPDDAGTERRPISIVGY